MDPLLQDLTVDEMARLIRRVEIEFVRSMPQSAPVIAAAEEGVEMWRSPVSFPFCNGVYLAREAGDDGAEVIERVMAFFARNHCSSYMVWIDDQVDRLAWDALLLARGFRFDPGSPGFALDTQTLPVIQTLPEGMEIVQVNDIVGLDYFGRTCGAGFGKNEADVNGFVELWTGFGTAGALTCYLGYVGDEIVACAAGHEVDGVVGVECVVTPPEFRRRGYGGAITKHIAYMARSKGYRWVTLTASEMGRPVYERIGFVHAGFADNYYYPDSA